MLRRLVYRELGWEGGQGAEERVCVSVNEWDWDGKVVTGWTGWTVIFL